MKKTLSLFAAVALLVVSQSAFAQKAVPSPLQKVSQMVGTTEVKIEYSRPSLDGRDMYEKLTPVGKRWRTGANARSIISFSKDVKLNGNEVKAGDYNLFTMPGKDKWVIMLNNNTKETNPFKYDEKNEVLRFDVVPTQTKDKIETFTINVTDFDKKKMDNANIQLAWENTSVKFKIEVNN